MLLNKDFRSISPIHNSDKTMTFLDSDSGLMVKFPFKFLI